MHISSLLSLKYLDTGDKFEASNEIHVIQSLE